MDAKTITLYELSINNAIHNKVLTLIGHNHLP